MPASITKLIGPPLEPLSGSEIRVLRYLPTNLTGPSSPRASMISSTTNRKSLKADYEEAMRAITAATRRCQAGSGAVSGAASAPRDRAHRQGPLVWAGAGHPGGKIACAFA
jgi:hypothetical protein